MPSPDGFFLEPPDDRPHIDPCPLAESQSGYVCGECQHACEYDLKGCWMCGARPDTEAGFTIRLAYADDCRCEAIEQAGREREAELRGGRL